MALLPDTQKTLLALLGSIIETFADSLGEKTLTERVGIVLSAMNRR